jgi:hypothetical protein
MVLAYPAAECVMEDEIVLLEKMKEISVGRCRHFHRSNHLVPTNTHVLIDHVFLMELCAMDDSTVPLATMRALSVLQPPKFPLKLRAVIQNSCALMVNASPEKEFVTVSGIVLTVRMRAIFVDLRCHFLPHHLHVLLASSSVSTNNVFPRVRCVTASETVLLARMKVTSVQLGRLFAPLQLADQTSSCVPVVSASQPIAFAMEFGIVKEERMKQSSAEPHRPCRLHQHAKLSSLPVMMEAAFLTTESATDILIVDLVMMKADSVHQLV